VQNANPGQCDLLPGRGNSHKLFMLPSRNDIPCSQRAGILKHFLNRHFCVWKYRPEGAVELLHAFQSRSNTLISVENYVVGIEMEILMPSLRVSKALYGVGEGLPVGHSAILAALRGDRNELGRSYQARPANCRVSVSTLIFSPSLINTGTRISMPVSSLAGLVTLPLAVSPRTPGSV
jgi:hypothetical protein